RPVTRIARAHRDILAEMARLMYDSSGIGLAAPQVGISEAIIIVDIGEGLYKLINPKIIKREGTQAIEEGCLSVPGVCIKVKRAKAVLVEAQDEEANKVKIEASGLFACVLQHEIDHLKGRLICDYASFLERLKIKKKLERIKQKTQDDGLPESKKQSCQLQL
ncbi:MAG: peptide deformylase, partial [Candidatus Omnitrophica bacterium]|nr:peptide deformylase [Candidatus Omnitrophota bacterium]